jgi:hypothetical protein
LKWRRISRELVRRPSKHKAMGQLIEVLFSPHIAILPAMKYLRGVLHTLPSLETDIATRYFRYKATPSSCHRVASFGRGQLYLIQGHTLRASSWYGIVVLTVMAYGHLAYIDCSSSVGLLSCHLELYSWFLLIY